MIAGLLRHQVRVYEMPKDVESNSTGGDLRELTPSPVWALIQPYEPGVSSDDRAISHRVRLRYHPEITLDSVLVYEDRRLCVRGLQHVDERRAELRLLCEEVV